MEKLRKIVEIGSNVAIILVAVLLSVYLINRYVSPTPAEHAPTAQAEAIKTGAKVPLRNVDWSKSERNLLMVLSTTCHFCSESMPFYQKIVEKNAGVKNIRLIAVLPQTADLATKYLSEHKVTVDHIIRANPGEVNVRGTPTLILTDGSGVILDSWIGKMPPEAEARLLSQLFDEL